MARVRLGRMLAGCVLLLPVALCCAADEAPAERWNAFGQLTYIHQWKDAFPAAYTNLGGSSNSLRPERERSWTASATGYFGLRPWRNGELYFVPEAIALLPLSDLHGLGGSIPNGELEKTGERTPTVYRARLFLRQTWNLGGEPTRIESGPMQLAQTLDSRRFVLTAGNLSIVDIFDKNRYAGDVRQQFLSMNFVTYAAYDFNADARGYTWGAAGEYYYDDWAVRAGRFVGPRYPNQLQLNYSIFNFYGDQIEVEHGHSLRGEPGKLRVLAYRNVSNMGSWDDAVNAFLADPGKNAAACTDFNYGSANAGAPDLCWVRQRRVKTGIGLSLEQGLAEGIGVFLRAMRSDGRTEVFSYTSTDSSLSFGGTVQGQRWRRPQDSLGIGFGRNWLSAAHVRYLGMGGIDGFIGDGAIRYRPEQTFEVYYSFNVYKTSWLTLDFQHIANPAYNADRGPVTVYGLRAHAEF